jgi:hypothetical protein
MRLSGAAAVVLAASGAWASETVCVRRDGNVGITYPAQLIAARILKDAGVQVDFKDGARSCTNQANAIVITVLYRAPVTEPPGRLAYAMPFERTHIVVFHDRVLAAARTSGMRPLLGHVLAHEIVHVLQGVVHHSPTGVMKAQWDYDDYVEMSRGRLRFTEEDLRLIRMGLANRSPRKPASSSLK